MAPRLSARIGGGLLMALIALPGPWGRTPAPGPLDHAHAFPGPGDPDHGARLFRDLDCVRCHTEPRTGHGVDIPASLRGEGSRSRPDWLAAYILEPVPLRFWSEGARPGIRMPRLVEDREDANDLAALLATWRDTVLVPEAPEAEEWAKDAQLVAAGRTLFDQYQCRGCHRLAGAGGEVGPSLDGVGRRRRAAYVLALIQDPGRMIPGTAMENKELWPEEARAITGYLMTLTAGGARPPGRSNDAE